MVGEVPFPPGETPFPTSEVENLVSQFGELPAANSCRLIDFESAKIIGGIIKDTWIIRVSGVKPWLAMKVILVPAVYVRRPEYWRIEVIGCLNGISMPVVTPYEVDLELTPAYGMGTEGVEVVGAGEPEQINVPQP